jgi:hypothetical protein
VSSLITFIVLFTSFWCFVTGANTTCLFGGWGTGGEKIHVKAGYTTLLCNIGTDVVGDGV